MLETILFACFALAAIAGALWVILGKNATWSALGLLVNFGSLGVLYILLNAPFVALIQFIVYAGAIVVLFLFVVMLLSIRRGEGTDVKPFQRYAGLALVVLVLAGMVFYGVRAAMPDAPIQQGDNVLALSDALLSGYLLPLEMAGVLLLTGVIAAVMLAGKRPERDS